MRMHHCFGQLKWWVAGLLAVAAAGVFFAGTQREQAAAEETATAPEEYAGQIQTITTRIKMKHRILERLLARKLTLVEAAGQFRDLDRRRPVCVWDKGHVLHSLDMPAAEAHCREVIHWLRHSLPSLNPCDRNAAISRLEDELELLLRKGPLRLPAESSSIVAEFQELML